MNEQRRPWTQVRASGNRSSFGAIRPVNPQKVSGVDIPIKMPSATSWAVPVGVILLSIAFILTLVGISNATTYLGNIRTGSVTTSKIGIASITSVKLADGAVTTDKLGSGSVHQKDLHSSVTVPIVDGAITTAKIADGSVTTSKLGPDAIIGVLATHTNVGIGAFNATSTAALFINGNLSITGSVKQVQAEAHIGVSSNATGATVLSVNNDFVLMVGPCVIHHNVFFSEDTDCILTYTGVQSSTFSIGGIVSYSKASNGRSEVFLRFHKNASPESAGGFYHQTMGSLDNSTDIMASPIHSQFSLATGDTVALYIASDDADDITVEAMAIHVRQE